MRICVYGAGAGGGHFAVRLAQAGHEVSAIARGANLQAIREAGLTLKSGQEVANVSISVTDNPAKLGVQDCVLVATKATALKDIAPAMRPLVSPHTSVLFPQNGMPFWYPVGLSDHLPRPPALELFDLCDTICSVLSPEQILGGLIYSANEMEAPGIIRNTSPGQNRIDIGAIVPQGDTHARSLRSVFIEAGIASPDISDIRAGIWDKLLVNMSGSAIALATGNRSSIASQDAELGLIYKRVVREGLAIAAAHGYPRDAYIDPERMLAKLLHHKPSLLQDYEKGRPMEIAQILLAPVAFARAAEVEAPTLEAIAAITARLARDRGLFP